MIRRPPRSTLDRSSAASDVYKRQIYNGKIARHKEATARHFENIEITHTGVPIPIEADGEFLSTCLLYTSDAADERSSVDLGGRRIIKKKNTYEHRGGTDN